MYTNSRHTPGTPHGCPLPLGTAQPHAAAPAEWAAASAPMRPGAPPRSTAQRRWHPPRAQGPMQTPPPRLLPPPAPLPVPIHVVRYVPHQTTFCSHSGSNSRVLLTWLLRTCSEGRRGASASSTLRRGRGPAAVGPGPSEGTLFSSSSWYTVSTTSGAGGACAVGPCLSRAPAQVPACMVFSLCTSARAPRSFHSTSAPATPSSCPLSSSNTSSDAGAFSSPAGLCSNDACDLLVSSLGNECRTVEGQKPSPGAA